MKASAIITALIIIVIGTLIAAGYLAYISGESKMTNKMNNSVKALYIAEAGIERAISDLALDADWYDGLINEWPTGKLNEDTFTEIDYDLDGEGVSGILNENEYMVEILKVNDNKVCLRSSGTVKEETRVVLQNVRRPTIFDWAVFAEDSIHLKSNARIDSYNSEEGPYNPLDYNDNGDTGTNATGSGVIYLDSNAEIHGDAVVGPGGDPETDITLKPNSMITGEKDSAEEETVLGQMVPPDDLPDKGSVSLEGGETLTISESGQYENIILDNDSYITIDSDVTIYITGALSLSSNSRIDIVNDVNVTFYINGSLEMDSNTTINNPSNDTTAFTFYGTDSLTEVSINSNTGIYGAVYARMADFTLESNARIFGSLIAKSVILNSNAYVHYDEALSGTGFVTGDKLKTEVWQEE